MVISLWGYMGAGKSSVGEALAQLHEWDFIDADQQIELGEGKTINNIFETYGESYFRELETNYLEALAFKINDKQYQRHLLLSTGGGMPIRETNRVLLKQMGPSIFLYVPFGQIAERLQGAENRPLWNQQELHMMAQRYEQRLPYYSMADIQIEVGNKDVQQIADEIKVKLIGEGYLNE